MSSYTSYKIRAIEIVGDYMVDMGLNDGDLCFFICNEIRGNNLYALSYQGELSIKRVVFDSFNKKINIKSENKKFNYPDLSLEESDPNLVILGKVKCWIHGYS